MLTLATWDEFGEELDQPGDEYDAMGEQSYEDGAGDD